LANLWALSFGNTTFGGIRQGKIVCRIIERVSLKETRDNLLIHIQYLGRTSVLYAASLNLTVNEHQNGEYRSVVGLWFECRVVGQVDSLFLVVLLNIDAPSISYSHCLAK
jgi:hypothetical protein